MAAGLTLKRRIKQLEARQAAHGTVDQTAGPAELQARLAAGQKGDSP